MHLRDPFGRVEGRWQGVGEAAHGVGLAAPGMDGKGGEGRVAMMVTVVVTVVVAVMVQYIVSDNGWVCYHHCTITTLKHRFPKLIMIWLTANHYRTITAPSPHHHCTITAPSLHHHCLDLAFHLPRLQFWL